jgi:hypothetical protein
VNVNSDQSLTIRNLQASLTQLQKKTTAEHAAARKQAEEVAARLKALEAQMSRVIPPATNKGRGKGKLGSDVLLETRVSDLEKAGAVHTNTAKSVATTNKEVTTIAATLSKATKEIATLQTQLEASVAASAAGHVQDVARQEAVNSNNARIIQDALETLASFKTQLEDLQQKVSTIEVSMSPAAPESNYMDQATAPNRHRGKRVGGRGSMGGDDDDSGERSPMRTPRRKSSRKRSSRQRSRTRSRSRSTARGRSTETSPRKTTPSKRYDVCMMCVCLVGLWLLFR